MYILIIAILTVAVVGFFILILVYIHDRQIRKMVADLLRRFDEAAKKENLAPSKKEILGNLVIGVDDINKKLIILKKKGDEYHTMVIDLKEVRDCSKRKIYHRIDISMGDKEKYQNYVEEIVLSFDIPLRLKQEDIPFYDSGVHGLRNLAEAEQKATEWETTIRKLLQQIHQERV